MSPGNDTWPETHSVRRIHSKYCPPPTGQGLLEPRLSHVGSYAIRCSAPEPLVRALVLHEVAAEAAANKREEIQLLAKREFVATLSQPRVQDDLNVREGGCALRLAWCVEIGSILRCFSSSQLLRTCYQLFCAVCYHCVQAVKAAREERSEQTVSYGCCLFLELHS